MGLPRFSVAGRWAFAVLVASISLLSGCASASTPSSSSGPVWGLPFKVGTTVTLGCLGLHDDNIFADGPYTFNNAHPQGLAGAPTFKCPPDILSSSVDPTHANEASLDLLVSGPGVAVIPLAAGTVIVADESCHFVVVDHGNNTWVAYLHIDVSVTVGQGVTTATTLGTTAAPHNSTCENSNAPHVHVAFMTGSGHTGTYVSIVGRVLCGYQVIKTSQYPRGALDELANPDHIVAPDISFTVKVRWTPLSRQSSSRR